MKSVLNKSSTLNISIKLTKEMVKDALLLYMKDRGISIPDYDDIFVWHYSDLVGDEETQITFYKKM